MVEVITKNTFISFIAKFEEGVSKDAPLHHFTHSRSRSADAVRSRPVADAHAAIAYPCTQRLNAVLSVGMSSMAPQQHDEESNDSLGNSQFGGTVSLSELEELRQQLGRALSISTLKSKERLHTNDCNLKHLRNSSISSLSTMAPDDASECGNFSNHDGLGKMRKVSSSGSVSTMASDWADIMSESSENVEFQLTVEEGPPQFQARPAITFTPTTGSQPATLPTTFAGKSHVNPEFSHASVPRHRNWETMKTNVAMEEPPTTLMIRNIPSRLSQQDLVLELNDLGFAGTFDFLYSPMDKNTSANVGYAFVNFVAPEWASSCMEILQGHCFRRSNRGSNKVARVSVAHMQGLEKNLQHYENAAVNVLKQTHRRPLVMTSIASIIA